MALNRMFPDGISMKYSDKIGELYGRKFIKLKALLLKEKLRKHKKCNQM